MKGAIKMQNVLRFDHQLTPCYNNELFGTDIMTGDQILHVLKLEKKNQANFSHFQCQNEQAGVLRDETV